VIGDLKNSDYVMNHVFWIGVYPALTSAMLNFVANTMQSFVLDPQSASRSGEEVVLTASLVSPASRT
jgi:CDP-6-deoxy-D-xylo-4-hexulose-3-dehydrase